MSKPIVTFILLVFVINLFAQSTVQSFSNSFRLLPQPKNIEVLNGTGLNSGDLQTIHLQSKAEKPVLYGELTDLPLSANNSSQTLSLMISKDKNIPENGEGYVLEVGNKRASVMARTQQGLFYGCITLNQLLEDAKDQNMTIPPCKVTDSPDIAYRSVHWDLKHHVDSLSYYYQMVDRLAGVKVNALIIEFEDKLRYEKAPLIGASNAISIEDFASLCHYARKRNIEISPLVQGIGHAPFILKHEKYIPLRDDPKSDWAFCALNPGTYELQFALYEDAIKATPGGKYIHIGGDEVGNSLGQSELAKKSGMQPFELQMYWLNKVTDFAKKHGRIPIFWDDMIFKLSGLYETTYLNFPVDEAKATWAENRHRLDSNLKLFPDNCVYMRWNYGSQYVWGNRAALDWYKSNNLHAMAATAAQTNWMLMPRNNSNREAIKGFSQITHEKKLDGILCTTWEDGSPHMETFMRGMYFFGLYSWNTRNIDAKEANEIFRHRFYGPKLADASFEFQDLLEETLSFWEIALIDEGDRDKSRRPFELMTLPDRNILGEWRKKYRDRLILAHQAAAKYSQIKEKIEKSQSLAVRNQYHLSLLYQINEVQHYPTRLILLLEQFDYMPTLGKTESVRALRTCVDDFKTIRGDFEKVFAQTRVLNAPDDYILDSNAKHPHPANAKTTDWMYRFELAMNQKMEEWFTNFDL